MENQTPKLVEAKGKRYKLNFENSMQTSASKVQLTTWNNFSYTPGCVSGNQSKMKILKFCPIKNDSYNNGFVTRRDSLKAPILSTKSSL